MFVSRPHQRPPPDSLEAVSTSETVTVAIERWREDVERASGRDSLVNFSDTSDETLDLAHAHPNGLAQFLAGRSTRLSNLFRQPAALELSRRRARTIRVISEQLMDRHGVHTAHLVSGVARWTATDETTGEPTRFKAPVLLHPVTIHAYGADRLDEEMHMQDSPRVNPALIRLLADQNIHIDPQDLQNLAQGTHGFNPRPAYSHLRDRAREVPEFSVIDRTVVGIFFDVLPALLDDFTRTQETIAAHPVLHHIAHQETHATAPRTGPDAASQSLELLTPIPETELSVPLDDDQRRVVAAARAGHSLRVIAAPGTGVTQTVAHIVFDHALADKKVLLVSPRPREILDTARRLSSLGAKHLIDDPGAVCPDIIDLADQERVLAETANQEPHQGSSDEALFALMDQRHSLHHTTAPWNVSIQDALAQLTLLTRSTVNSTTKITLDKPTITKLNPENREHVRELLAQLQLQQGFAQAARQSPWWLAHCETSEATHTAIAAAKRLASGTLRNFITCVQDIAAQAGLTEPKSLDQCRHIIDLLHSVANTLTVFVDELYQRPIDAMVAATATSTWRAERGITMSMSERRKMRKQAKSFTRTKIPTTDLHELLVDAAKERQLWQQHARSGGWPQTVAEVADARVLGHQVFDDIDVLTGVLETTPHGGALYDAPLESLVSRLRGLAHDPALSTLPERIALTHQLASFGLTPFMQDLHRREVPAENITTEFDVCWWASVLAALTSTLNHQHPTTTLMHQWRTRRDAEHLATRHTAINKTRGNHAVCTAVTPLRMPELLRDKEFDTVIVLGAHSCAVPEGVLALARGPQSIIFGDPDGVAPRGLDESIESAAIRQSLLNATETAMPTTELSYQHRMPKQLTDFMVRPSTWAVAAVDPGITLTPVRPRTHHRHTPGVTPVSTEEVKTVVDTVLDHARHRSHQSLAVITLTRAHARHIADAVRSELMFDTPLLEWFGAGHHERFVVTDIHRSEDIVRDRVIVSMGLTPGTDLPLHQILADIDRAGADRAAATAFTRSRTYLDVISSVSADDIIELAPATPFNVMLSRALRTAADPVSGPESIHGGLPPLMSELAAQLGHEGFDAISTGGSHGWPDLAVTRENAHLVAIMTDTRWSEPRADQCGNSNVILDDLQVTEHLERFGWHVVPVTSLDVYNNQLETIDHIAARVNNFAHRPRTSRPVTTLPADEVSERSQT